MIFSAPELPFDVGDHEPFSSVNIYDAMRISMQDFKPEQKRVLSLTPPQFSTKIKFNELIFMSLPTS